MARDLSAYLQDIYDACIAIEDVIQGVTLEDYRKHRAVRSSVEREFIIIGEALRRITVSLMSDYSIQYLIRVPSLISEIFSLMTMAQLTTIRCSGLFTRT